MRNKLFVIGILLCSNITHAQQRIAGLNKDIHVTKVGVKPYEMKNTSLKKATLSFMDCSKWYVQTENCEAALYRSNQEIVADEFSGKIVYKTTAPKASVFLGLTKPMELNYIWDCLDVWTFGDHWLWGEPHYNTSMQVYACFKGKDGQEHEVNMVQQGYPDMAHKYWFLNHIKLNKGKDLYTHFLGFKLKGQKTDTGTQHTVFFNSVYIYKEKLNLIQFKPFPEQLPFPCRKETILPLQKGDYRHKVSLANSQCVFDYTDEKTKLSYLLPKKNLLGDIQVYHDGMLKQTITKREMRWKNGEVAVLKSKKIKLNGDTLFFEAEGNYQNKRVPFKGWYTIAQKSLVFHLEEIQEVGNVRSLSTGMIAVDKEGIQTLIPFLKYYGDDRPGILYQNDLFTFMIFDWYKTHASSVTAGAKSAEVFTGGEAVYIPKTDGKHNSLYETLFINVSPDVHEVLPTVDNPASPMRSIQADRLWAINGGSDLNGLGQFVTGLRSKGVEKVTIRYHEDFWREGGESYTFKLTPNPQLGIENVQKYIQFVKDNDWRVGLYSNYTDMATVNERWSPDWMKRGPKGEWEVSWSRCYSPKPQIAWEQQAILAPQIQKLFNTNHSYCDVHTAISPISRVDFDHRVPDAAMMKGVYNRYGMLLMNERKAYNGPVYSEGGNHWWYAGLLDGNYANDDLLKLPIFPDFNLLKIHPLEMDAANTGQGHQYICYAMAYGNIGILSDGVDAVTRYAFLQPIQEDYVMVPVKEIAYFKDGKAYNTSEAIKKDLLKTPCLKITYQSGLETYVNFGKEEWIIQINDKNYSLPEYGFFTHMPQSGKQSSSVWINGSRLDEVYSKNLYYLNTHGKQIEGKMRGNGHYLLKKEKFSWELIPLDQKSMIEFDLSLLKSDFIHAKVVGVDKEGRYVKEIPQTKKGIVTVQAEEGVYKYQLIPQLD